MAQITIIFDKEEDTHTIDIDSCTIKQLLLAYQSLGSKIEQETDMPVELAKKSAYALQETEI